MMTKRSYCRYMQCPKMHWLDRRTEALWKEQQDFYGIPEKNREVMTLAKRYFGSCISVPEEMEDGQAAELTKALIEINKKRIADAAFIYVNAACRVDLLVKTDAGYEIYEIKSSAYKVLDEERLDNPYSKESQYAFSLEYQAFVMQQLGYQVVKAGLIQIQTKYVRQGALDVREMFHMEDLTKTVLEQKSRAAHCFEIEEELLNPEPVRPLGMHCFRPYACGYWEYCSRAVKRPGVFEVVGLKKEQMFECFDSGIRTFEQLLAFDTERKEEEKLLTERQKLQIETELYGRLPKIDTDAIQSFLDQLTYPLYFLDFEMIAPEIPMFDLTSPYTRIPFQYSLHYLEEEGGELKTSDFLAEPGTDPRNEMARALCRDIPEDACLIAYGMGAEQSVLKMLAEYGAECSAHLLKLSGRLVDLLQPFLSLSYYCREFNGRTSLKKVIAGLYPDEPSLHYENLEGVQRGDEAMRTYIRLLHANSITAGEQEEISRQLKAYCGLDTYAMVKIWEKLKETCQK